MRIQEIQIDNLLGVKSVHLKLDKPVAFVAGRNGTLKSSIYDCVLAAITRAPMRDVNEAKDYGMLVHEGEKAGGALVVMAPEGDEESETFGFNMPKGKFNGPEISDAMRVALGGQRFSSMDTKARITFLQDLTGIKPKKSVIQQMLLEQKANPVFVDEVLVSLSGGFDAASKYAAERASDAKRDWCRTTARKAYGKEIAETWEAEVLPVPDGDLDIFRQQLANYDASAVTLNQSIGAIKQAVAQTKADGAERAKLAEAPARLKSIQEQLPLAEKELAEYLIKVEALRERAKGTARIGLVHDLAKHIAGEDPDHMTKGRALAHAKVMAAYMAAHGALADAGQVDLEAQAELPTYENGLKVLQNRVANLKRDLDSATQAKGQYDALAPAVDEPDGAAELAEIEQALKDNAAARERLQGAVAEITGVLESNAAADKRTADARTQNKTIADWTQIANALAPAGIPHQLLVKALVPVNAKLHQASIDVGWKRVIIRDDMEITCDGRLYQLESKSFKWRADAMIAEVVADISGNRMLMLDEYDILDIDGRGDFLTWIDLLVDEGDLECVLIFGTLTAPAKGLPETFQSFWVADGGIAQPEEPKAA